MRMLWYWPFIFEQEMTLASLVPREGDHLTIQAIDRPLSPAECRTETLELYRNLPDVNHSAGRGIRWFFSRKRTYLARHRARNRQWNRGDYDLLHIHYHNRFTDTWMSLPRPVVLSVHDAVPHEPLLSPRVETSLLRRACARADHLVVHHESVAEALSKTCAVSPERITLIPQQVYPVPSAAKSTGKPENAEVLLFGNLRKNKGLDTLVGALKLMKGQDLTVRICGQADGDMLRVATLAAREDPRVQLELGPVSLKRKHELFHQASLVVLPYSSFASQSGVLHDAAGHNVPVLVTDVGALGVTVRDWGLGEVVSPNDPSSLAEAMIHMLSSNLWNHWSLQAERYAEARNPAKIATALRNCYSKVV